MVQFENKEVKLCYSDSEETLVCSKTASEAKVSHGWFILFKEDWIAYNIPGEMIGYINKLQLTND